MRKTILIALALFYERNGDVMTAESGWLTRFWSLR